MTAARRAALRKAQIASAKKRKRNKKIKRVAGTAGVIAVTATAAGGGYYRGKAKRSRFNVVNTVAVNAPKPMRAIEMRRTGKGVDVFRWTYDNQNTSDDDVIDYGKIGSVQPGYKQTLIRKRKPKGKPNTHSKGKRINVVYSDGTILSGARQRWTEKQRMTYSPNKRSASYRDARDRPVPPRWLDPYKTKQKQRADALKAKKAAARARKRGTK
jgi:hypothetical protein